MCAIVLGTAWQSLFYCVSSFILLAQFTKTHVYVLGTVSQRCYFSIGIKYAGIRTSNRSNVWG